MSLSTRKGRSTAILEINERSGNVAENKGALWKKRRQSWNVYENKGTYTL